MSRRIYSLPPEQLVWPVIPGPPRMPKVPAVRCRSEAPAPAAKPPAPKNAPTPEPARRDPDVVWASRLMGACALLGLASLALSCLVR